MSRGGLDLLIRQSLYKFCEDLFNLVLFLHIFSIPSVLFTLAKQLIQLLIMKIRVFWKKIFLIYVDNTVFNLGNIQFL